MRPQANQKKDFSRGSLKICFSVSTLAPPFTPLYLAVNSVLVVVLSSIIILTLVRQMNRPLRRLQNAANSYSKTGKAPYLDTNHGPLEIRQVNQAFNHMVYTLEQTERDRQIMLAGISHDLRTPLTRIRLTAEMLPDEFFREGLIYDVDDMDAKTYAYEK